MRGSVLARGAGDLIALQLFWVWGNAEETDTGAIVLREGQPVSVRVTNQGAPVADARVAVLGSGRWRNASLVLEATTDASGALHVPLMPPGAVTILASGPTGTGRGRATETLPRTDPTKPMEVELAEERIVDVEVVDKETGAPVVGARVLVADGNTRLPPSGEGYLPQLDVPVTDEQGRTQIRGLATDEKTRLRVAVVADGYPRAGSNFGPGGRLNEARVRSTENEVRIELVRLRTVTFPIESGEIDPPAEGAALKILSQGWGPVPGGDDGATATIRGGDLVLENLKPSFVVGTVASEGGLVASFRAPANKTEGKAVTFRKGHRLQVRVRTASGEPAVGVHVALQGRRNFKLVGPEQTDENGEATLPTTDLAAGDVKVLSHPSQWWNATTHESVDLTKHEGVLEVTLQEETQITVAVRVDGPRGEGIVVAHHPLRELAAAALVVRDGGGGIELHHFEEAALDGGAALLGVATQADLAVGSAAALLHTHRVVRFGRGVLAELGDFLLEVVHLSLRGGHALLHGLFLRAVALDFLRLLPEVLPLLGDLAEFLLLRGELLLVVLARLGEGGALVADGHELGLLAVAAAALRAVHGAGAGEDAGEGVVILHPDRIELVIVATRAADGEPEEQRVKRRRSAHRPFPSGRSPCRAR